MRPLRLWRGRVLIALAAAIVLVACGSDAAALSTADSLHYLITIDQLVAPDFTVTNAAAHIDSTTLAGGDATLATALTANGLQSAASVEYQRDVDFSTSNGPIDIVATVERFGATSKAS